MTSSKRPTGEQPSVTGTVFAPSDVDLLLEQVVTPAPTLTDTQWDLSELGGTADGEPTGEHPHLVLRREH